MKVSKEFIVLIVAILVLAGYLAFQHKDRLHYRLPDMKKVTADAVTRIDIVQHTGTITLSRKDGGWIVLPQGWQADPEKVKGMLSALAGLKITDLVSESGTYDRYELDPARKIQVRAFSGNNLEQDVSMGKAAPTWRHTFVMLPGNKNVYLAEGKLKEAFAVSAADIRNTLVLSFDPLEITGIQVEHEGSAMSLTRQDAPPVKSGKPAAEPTWKTEKGEPLTKVSVDTLLAVLSKIYCEGFLDDSLKASLKKPVYMIRLKGKQEYSLSVYEKTGNKVPALSSGSSSPFVLPDYKLDGIKKAVQDVSGKQDIK